MRHVPILEFVNEDELDRLIPVFNVRRYRKVEAVVRQGEKGETFYLIMEGSAKVNVTSKGDNTEGDEMVTKEVDHLFPRDYFGEMALLNSEPRKATVVACSDEDLVCLELPRKEFQEVLGPLKDIMKREKSPENVRNRLLATRALDGEEGDSRLGGPDTPRPRGERCEVLLVRRNLDGEEVEVHMLSGHAEEVAELLETKGDRSR